MKLHLTATSERGKPVTKSGNEYIKIEIKNEKREVIANYTFKWCHHYDYLPYKGYDLLKECGYCKDNNKPKTAREVVCFHCKEKCITTDNVWKCPRCGEYN